MHKEQLVGRSPPKNRWFCGALRQVAAFDERCCHKRMALSPDRLIEDGLLECACHHLCYNATGRCVRVPSTRSCP
jgi:phenylpropionate dioxygenase-like ring-hydroxylating dioxygenase large terminal subunit